MYSRIVNDHVVGSDTGALVLLRNAAEGVQEQPVTELHDVSFVDAGDFLKLMTSVPRVNFLRYCRRDTPCGCS